MALIFRVTSLKTLLGSNVKACAGVLPSIQKRGITGKVMRQGIDWPARKEPFPWETKDYTLLNSLFDRTVHRFDDNTKVIVVEGPIAVGKTAFAKQLAEELDMRHFPEPTMELRYIDEYGFDIRTLDEKLPSACRTYDHTNFCREPKHENTGAFQLKMYNLRYELYIDALAHVLNTGQGVVLERCPYSDHVFLDAMLAANFISPGVHSVYQDVKDNTIGELMKPHLVIYLDIPVNVVKDRVKARNLPYEKDTKALSDVFLSAMEKSYKQKYLKHISTHAEILVYDWTDQGDTEIVVEDIERIDFDRFERFDPKLFDWRMANKSKWCDARMTYTNRKYSLMNYFNVPRYDVPELMMSGDDYFAMTKLVDSTKGKEYTYGYNSSAGDSGMIFKNSLPKRVGQIQLKK